MALKTVGRDVMRSLHVGQTRMFTLMEPKTIKSVYENARQLKNEEKVHCKVKGDYNTGIVSITRIS